MILQIGEYLRFNRAAAFFAGLAIASAAMIIDGANRAAADSDDDGAATELTLGWIGIVGWAVSCCCCPWRTPPAAAPVMPVALPLPAAAAPPLPLIPPATEPNTPESDIDYGPVEEETEEEKEITRFLPS